MTNHRIKLTDRQALNILDINTPMCVGFKLRNLNIRAAKYADVSKNLAIENDKTSVTASSYRHLTYSLKVTAVHITSYVS